LEFPYYAKTAWPARDMIMINTLPGTPITTGAGSGFQKVSELKYR
jgi:hypothetical protein